MLSGGNCGGKDEVRKRAAILANPGKRRCDA
jgi:hypothetical protein